MKDPFFADYLERLENLQRDLHKEIEGLPSEAMDWTPGPEMNSLAVLLAHIAGSLRYWVGDVALGDPSARVREHEFQTRGLTNAEMLIRLDAVINYARGALPRLSLADLEKKGIEEDGKTLTRGWALLHALEHASPHLGQVQLSKQLWQQKGR